LSTCPNCGSPRVHRSRTKGWIEHIRKGLGPDRPHRCPDCRWRGWAVETARPFEAEDAKPSREPAPDFALIDRAVRRSPQPSRSRPADSIFETIDDKLKTI
jgi:hypothetical protein